LGEVLLRHNILQFGHPRYIRRRQEPPQ
jgi:hypothetical protein